MPRANDSEMGVVAGTLRQFREGCGWTCGTCGGYAGTVHRLRESYRRDRNAYLAELVAFRADDFVAIGGTAPLARAALDVVPSPFDRARVLDAWAEVVSASPEVSLIVLHVAGPHLQLSRRLVRVMTALAESRSVLAQHLVLALGPLALENRLFWHEARASLQRSMDALVGWEELQPRADEERALQEAHWERVWAERERARAAEVARLRSLPLEERLRTLVAGGRPFDRLEPELAEAPDEEVQALSSDLALEIAREIGSAAGERWLVLKHRLVAVHTAEQQRRQRVRAQSRQDEIASIAQWAPLDRLALIAREERRPLEYWPIEWTAVEQEGVAALDPELRARLADRIRRQVRRLRSPEGREAWRGLGRRLEESLPDEGK